MTGTKGTKRDESSLSTRSKRGRRDESPLGLVFVNPSTHRVPFQPLKRGSDYVGSPTPPPGDLRLLSIVGDTVVLVDVRTGQRITARVGRSPAATRWSTTTGPPDSPPLRAKS
jgi:hypothetical protein